MNPGLKNSELRWRWWEVLVDLSHGAIGVPDKSEFLNVGAHGALQLLELPAKMSVVNGAALGFTFERSPFESIASAEAWAKDYRERYEQRKAEAQKS